MSTLIELVEMTPGLASRLSPGSRTHLHLTLGQLAQVQHRDTQAMIQWIGGVNGWAPGHWNRESTDGSHLGSAGDDGPAMAVG